MDVAPGEIIHMDENGAVKFPRSYLREVLENCKLVSAAEDKKMATDAYRQKMMLGIADGIDAYFAGE